MRRHGYFLTMSKTQREIYVERVLPVDEEIVFPILVEIAPQLPEIQENKFYYYIMKGKARIAFITKRLDNMCVGRYILKDGKWSAPTCFKNECFARGRSLTAILPPFLIDEEWAKEVADKSVYGRSKALSLADLERIGGGTPDQN